MKALVVRAQTQRPWNTIELICGPEYPEILLELKWDSLELIRKYLSLVQMYKIILGYCDINYHHYFDIIGITRIRSKQEYKIRPKVARANYFKYSFFIDILMIGTRCLLM